MGYRYRRHKRSTSSKALGDTSHIANRLSWRGALILGVVLFIVFYWLIPAWLDHLLTTMEGSRIRPAIEVLFARRIHWVEWLGVAMGLVCVFYAIYHYFTAQRLTRGGERRVGYLSRLLARFLD
jgi:nicotinamide riboside transporter PnuC